MSRNINIVKSISYLTLYNSLILYFDKWIWGPLFILSQLDIVACLDINIPWHYAIHLIACMGIAPLNSPQANISGIEIVNTTQFTPFNYNKHTSLCVCVCVFVSLQIVIALSSKPMRWQWNNLHFFLFQFQFNRFNSERILKILDTSKWISKYDLT